MVVIGLDGCEDSSSAGHQIHELVLVSANSQDRSRQRTAESGERIGAIVMPSSGETAVAKIVISLPTPSSFSNMFFQLLSRSRSDPVSSEWRWHGSSGMIFLGNVT